MANEITLSASLAFAKGTIASITRSVSSLSRDVAGSKVIVNVQNINTSEEAIQIGDAGAGGYMFLKNLDATNYVQIKPGTGDDPLIRLKPGDIALFRLDDSASAPYAQANTAACDLEVMLISA